MWSTMKTKRVNSCIDSATSTYSGYVALWLCSYVALWLFLFVAMWLPGTVCASPVRWTPINAPVPFVDVFSLVDLLALSCSASGFLLRVRAQKAKRWETACPRLSFCAKPFRTFAKILVARSICPDRVCCFQDPCNLDPLSPATTTNICILLDIFICAFSCFYY